MFSVFALFWAFNSASASTIYSQPYIGTNINLGTSEPYATRYYAYYFAGATLGVPLTDVGSWTSTAPINKIRVKKISGSCNDIGNSALIIGYINGVQFAESFSFHGTGTGDNCDMTTYGGTPIPVGADISAIFLVSQNVGAYDMVLDGSSSNGGISLNGNNDAKVNGGFAFQLCDNSVCDGEFIPVTPPPPECTVNCNSSVLFLPGIKGSILKTSSDTLWPPSLFSINDISQLAINDDGESVNDIHTDGILNEFHGTPIYAPFSSFMDSISGDDKLIKEWLPLAYDWRFSSEKIVESGIKTEDGTIDIIEKIEALASESKTGKVTIITHSMGGLLGKAIIKKLQDDGKDNLIDSFVMVGTPQLGTPQAIASMLHGDSEGIVRGLIVANPIAMRRIAQNMPSAYDLLPSPRYFSEVVDPVIKFSVDASFTQAWRDFWGTTINTYDNFLQFVTGTGIIRTKPIEQNLQDPEVLRANFMASAANFHSDYDSYQFPEHIRVVQIAGWGRPTTKAIEYKTHHGISNYDVIPTIEGDGTVVYSSATSSAAGTYFFDLGKYRKDKNITISHKDLLSANPIQNMLEHVIKNEETTGGNFITTDKPIPDDLADQLIVSTKSPVVLGASDQFGNFTGIDPTQDLAGDLLVVLEDIPGSTFSHTSESQSIFLPKTGSYNMLYKATGSGPTTVTIENFSTDTVTPVVSYIDLPTKLNSKATFTINSTNPQNTEIILDIDGDGDEDATFHPSTGVNMAPYPFNGFLQPINDTTYQADQKQSVFKAGSTVPVKFQLKKSDGTLIQTSTLPTWLQPQIISSMNASIGESVYSDPATSGSTFKWDPINQQYIYNWSTKGFTPGKWYKLSVKLDNDSIYFVTVGLK
jgi:pimeloyl-ACP methyl ester carboxylesterase